MLRKDADEGRTARDWWILLALSACAGLWSAGAEWSASSFIPFNGHLQNYWTLHRLSLGETPFADFPVYLGAGHLFAAWPLFALLGGDFRAATASHNFLHGAMLAFSVLFPCRFLLGWRWLPSILVAAVGFRVFAEFLATGWSSVLGFRSFLPIVVALVVLFALPRPGARPLPLLLYGAAAGACVAWSNDYGFPALAVLLGMLVLDRRRIPEHGLAWAGAAAGALAAATLSGFGDPLAWLDGAVLGPASVQSWYFNPDVESKTYSLLDFPWSDPAFVISIGLVLALLALRLRLGGDPRRDALLALLLAALGGFTLACLGGTHELRYSLPLWRYALPPLATMLALAAAAASPGLLRRRYGPFFRHPLFGAAMAGTLSLLAFTAIPRPFELAPDLRLAQARGMLLPVPSLGLSSWPEVQRAAETGRSLSEAGRTIVSAYAGPVSIGAGSDQGVPPYIIHSWGKDLARVHAAWNDRGTDVVETLDHDALVWGLWGVRMHWPLFRDLFRDRKPAGRTAWSLLWEFRPEPLALLPARCEVSGGGEVLVSASPEHLGGMSWWADVALDVRTDFRPTLVPVAGRASVMSLTQGEEPRRELGVRDIVLARWTAELRSGRVEAPVLLDGDGAPAVLRVRAWPEGRASAEISGCTARLVAPYGETVMQPMRMAELRASSHLRLFALDQPEAGRVVVGLSNPFLFSSILEGDTVVLPDGSRRIVASRDFGSFTYRRVEGETPPPPGSELLFLPTGTPRR